MQMGVLREINLQHMQDGAVVAASRSAPVLDICDLIVTKEKGTNIFFLFFLGGEYPT